MLLAFRCFGFIRWNIHKEGDMKRSAYRHLHIALESSLAPGYTGAWLPEKIADMNPGNRQRQLS